MKIYFADCGIVGIIGINDIRMDIIMEEMPVQIMRCSLWNLKPSVGTKGWSSEEQKSILNEALKSGEFLVVLARVQQDSLGFRHFLDGIPSDQPTD